jgi:hypothetical protein
VAWTVFCNKNQISKFIYRDDLSENALIDKWLNEMLKDASLIHENRQQYYKILGLLEYLQKTFIDEIRED